MQEQSILPIIHPEAFYGNPADVPDRPVVFAGLEFKVPSSAVGNLPLFTKDPMSGVQPKQCKHDTQLLSECDSVAEATPILQLLYDCRA